LGRATSTTDQRQKRMQLAQQAALLGRRRYFGNFLPKDASRAV
jgi:hypothetical protein